MSWLTAKYGGTSLATPKSVERVAAYLTRQKALSPAFISLGDTTDSLLQALEAAAAGDRLGLVSRGRFGGSGPEHLVDAEACLAIESLLTSGDENLLEGASFARPQTELVI